jgi:iron complex outermembrane receptor protein
MKFFLKPLAAVLAVAPLAAFAQETKLPPVIVTAPKADLPPSGPSAAELNSMRASTSDAASLLRDVPGVSLYGAGGVSSLPAIHGMADDRLNIKVDGVEIVSSCPNHMNSALSYIDPTSVGSVAVFAGIAPVSAGGDSIGGSIVVDPAPPLFAAAGQDSIFKGEAGAFYRGNGSAKGANLSATYAAESLNVTYVAATAKSDNYKAAANFKTTTASGRPGHTLRLDEVGSTAYDSRNQTLAFALKGGSHLVEAKLGYQDIPYELYPNQRMDMLGNTEHRFNLRYLGLLDWGTLEARAYHETVQHHMDFGADKQFVYGPTAPSTVVAPGMPMDTEGKTTGASIKADVQLSQQDLLRVGGEYLSYRLDDWWPPSPSSLAGMVSSPGVPATSGGMAPNTFWNIKDGKRDRLGVFAEWEARWNPQWLSLLGARVEQVKMDAGPVQGYNNMMGGYVTSATNFNTRDHQRTDHNFDLTALARHTPDAKRSFEFGYAQKTRSPNLHERYDWSQNGMALEMNNFVGDGNGYLGNLDLKHEVAHTITATGDWHDAARTEEFKFTPYYTRVSDYIDAVRCPGSGAMMNALCGGVANNTATNKFVHLQYANQSARLYGFDISGRMPLAKTGWGELGLKGLLNYTNGKNLDSGGNLYNIMPLNAKLTFTHQQAGWDDGIELVGVKAKTDVSAVRQEVKTAGYSLINLRASYAWKQARVDFGVENLFDKFYYLPLGGAYTGQGTTMSLNGVPWGIPVPGPARSIYAGLNVKF